MIRVLTNYKNLVELLVLSSPMNSDGFNLLFSEQGLIHPHCKVSNLVLYGMAMDEDQAFALRDLLSHPRNNIQALEISMTVTSPKIMDIVAQGLYHPNNIITSLSLNRNHLGDEGGEILGKVLRGSSCRVSHLCLEETGMEELGVGQVALGLRVSFVRSLRLSSEIPVSSKAMSDVSHVMNILGSKWAGIVLTLLSVNHVFRLGSKKGCKMRLPDELIRLIALTLPFVPPSSNQ